LKLALGTVQFGLPYGITNQGGQISFNEVADILQHARRSGVDTIDTAIDYGESEKRLGEIGVESWRVVSKLPAVPENCEKAEEWVINSVLGSLERLHIPKLHALLLHRPLQLLGSYGDVIYRTLDVLRDQGKIGKIGVSIYRPNELDALWPHFPIEIVQAPFSILDRRLETSGWLARLHQAGTEIHVRSIFLQGLLLVEAGNHPEYFDRWQALWDQWHDWLNDSGLTPLQACIGFALQTQEIDRVIVGIDSLKHLTEIIEAVGTDGITAPPSLAIEDANLLNPLKWVVNEHAKIN